MKESEYGNTSGRFSKENLLYIPFNPLFRHLCYKRNMKEELIKYQIEAEIARVKFINQMENNPFHLLWYKFWNMDVYKVYLLAKTQGPVK